MIALNVTRKINNMKTELIIDADRIVKESLSITATIKTKGMRKVWLRLFILKAMMYITCRVTGIKCATVEDNECAECIEKDKKIDELYDRIDRLHNKDLNHR